MIKIPLGRSGLFAEIDNDDFDKVSHCQWYLFKDSHNSYAVNRYHVRMHRLILGASKEQEIDHEDGNGLNNKRNNIRISSRSQNMSNRKAFKKFGSKYKGVFKDNNGNKWIAACRKDGKLERRYKETEIQAAIEYNKMAIEKHGEFAKLNDVGLQ